MSKVYKSDACAAIHETAEVLYEHGVIDRTVMVEFDETCLADREETSAKEQQTVLGRNDTLQSTTIKPLTD